MLPKLMEKIGIRASTAHLRFGDDWMLQPQPLDAGPTWEDRLAERTGLVREEGRVRIYLTAQQATEEAKRSVTRAAQREYQVLPGITHRGLRVALDEQKAARLHTEAKALELVGGAVVGWPARAGRAHRARPGVRRGANAGCAAAGRGQATYHELARFGGDLFTALDQLAAKGVRHRDLKPDNFGVFQRADRSWQLMLFDFSLAGISERDITAGSRGYLDPFLGTDRRPVFDDHAERYAAAITLRKMASNEKPEWGDGITDPRTTTDETPTIAVEISPGLASYLRAVWTRVEQRLLRLAAEPETVLFVHDAGLLARYYDQGRARRADPAAERRAAPAGSSARILAAVPGGIRAGRSEPRRPHRRSARRDRARRAHREVPVRAAGRGGHRSLSRWYPSSARARSPYDCPSLGQRWNRA
ncbi:MAG TPA: hypothetical protein VFQ77_04135 [Pseudonocardiaceae bacterium]|nr:hypothetical protein [Pseudonocardiaceae bacterium]